MIFVTIIHMSELHHPFRQLTLTEEMLKIPDGRFIIGSDLRVTHDVTLRPHTATTVNINLAPENIPFGERLVRQSHMSARSIFMQVGIEAGSETPQIIDWTLQSNDESKLTAAIPLTNVGNRTVKIPEGMGVGSLYLWNGKTIRNGELEEYVQRGDIRMSGDEGVDWRFYTDKDNTLAGIQYRIDPDFKKYISPSIEPIEMSTFSSRNDRPKIDRLFEDVPETEIPIDWITQTKSSIGLSRKVHAVIEPKLNAPFFDAQHRNSLLLKGGDEWPIRLELVSPTVEGALPRWILFRFAKAA